MEQKTKMIITKRAAQIEFQPIEKLGSDEK